MMGPRRIVCLTEESVETLYHLGLQERIVGVSVYVKRPAAARRKPKVTSFIRAQVPKILALKPDLVLGYSDIQKDIARELIGAGLEVWISNHRDVAGIFEYVRRLAALFEKRARGQALITKMQRQLHAAQREARRLPRVPRVYFEEWDEPMIFGSEWVSEVLEIAGGRDVFGERRGAALAMQRTVSVGEVRASDPDIVFACWCGKRFRPSSMETRFGHDNLRAQRDGCVWELPPEIFLQPGPAPLLDGLSLLTQYYKRWGRSLMP